MQIDESITKKVSDFIYNYPDVAVVLLNKHGYVIAMDKASLSQINELIFTALFLNNDINLAQDIETQINNEGYNNIIPLVVAGGVSLVSSLIGSFSAKKTAQRQLAVQKQIALANLSMEEKLKLEEIRTNANVAQINILANSLKEYRIALQKEGTARLKDTWLYLTGIGISIGIITGILFLIPSKSHAN